jgi:hypothetical protein
MGGCVVEALASRCWEPRASLQRLPTLLGNDGLDLVAIGVVQLQALLVRCKAVQEAVAHCTKELINVELGLLGHQDQSFTSVVRAIARQVVEMEAAACTSVSGAIELFASNQSTMCLPAWYQHDTVVQIQSNRIDE